MPDPLAYARPVPRDAKLWPESAAIAFLTMVGVLVGLVTLAAIVALCCLAALMTAHADGLILSFVNLVLVIVAIPFALIATFLLLRGSRHLTPHHRKTARILLRTTLTSAATILILISMALLLLWPKLAGH